MLKIGVTGSIGGGKTTVCRIFSILGIPVYNADEHAKELMEKDPRILEKLKKSFGDDVVQDNKLNRVALAAVVFGNEQKLKELNGIIHPAVFANGKAWMESQKSPYIIKEAALLYESGSWKELDKIIVVTAPEEIRIQRVMQRSHLTSTQVKDRIQHQMDEQEKVERADYVIINDGKTLLIPQVSRLHEKFLEVKSE